MSDRIAQALIKLFDRHRIVFWYDAQEELRDDFEALQLPGVEKLELANNEYGLKYRLLRAEPGQKFLLYRAGAPPADLENWLLDVQLAHAEFRTDQVAIWLAELELGLEFADVVAEHAEFFQAVKRKDALRKLLKADDTSGLIRLRMLAVCAGSEPRIDAVLENLLQEVAEGRDEKFKLIARCRLDSYLWEQLDRQFDYQSAEKSLKDFQLRIFRDCYEMAVDPVNYQETRKRDQHENRPPSRMSQDIQVFLKRWKDSRQFGDSFEILSGECAVVLAIEQDLTKRDFRELMEVDYFRLIDQKIISDLVRAVAERTAASGEVAHWIRHRRQGRWYETYRHLYEAVAYAARFNQILGEATLTMDSLADGVQRYCHSWYQLDQLYRKFTYHARKSGQQALLGPLAEQMENFYANNFLLKVNDHWQTFVDGAKQWSAPPILQQRDFFEREVKPFLQKENKICVVISDALRFEIGEELLSLIRQEDRYTADLAPALAMLPSYTQLGMAALLPNRELALADNESGVVLVDGQSSQGTPNRVKILTAALRQRVTAVKADEFMKMNRDDSRALLRDHEVVYVYHNHIDAVGGKRESEERVGEAVEETLEELLRLIKKLFGANASNVLVTADHGFIYQHRAIEESDFATEDAAGERILYRDRRFVLGKGLKKAAGLRTFTTAELGLAGEVEVQIPKSINRLRIKGAGSRFVHGGASLQEVVIPTLRINKKRQSDITLVGVDIVRGSSMVISSGQHAVLLYQAQPVTDKVQPRQLRAGIFTEAGELISDSHDLMFDLTSENPREREMQVRFVLTRKADAANGQDVILRLDEPVAGTTHYKEYKSLRYQLWRAFTSDFDE